MLTRQFKIELYRPFPTSRDKSRLAFDKEFGSTRISLPKFLTAESIRFTCPDMSGYLTQVNKQEQRLPNKLSSAASVFCIYQPFGGYPQHTFLFWILHYLEKEYELYQSGTIIWLFQRKGVTLQRFFVQLLRFQNKTERYCCTLHYYNYEKKFPTMFYIYFRLFIVSAPNRSRVYFCVRGQWFHKYEIRQSRYLPSIIYQ